MGLLTTLQDIILDQLLPYLGAVVAERKLRQQTELICMSEGLPDNLHICLAAPVERVREAYEAERNRRKGIEDKAKSNLVGITVSFAVLGAALGLLKSGSSALPVGTWTNLFVTVLELGFVSLLLSGLGAAQALRVQPYYQVTLSEELTITSDNELKARLLRCVSLNQRLTNIRSNYCDASFTGIRNGIVCMGVVGILLAFPLIGRGQPHDFQESAPSQSAQTEEQADSGGQALMNWDLHSWVREDWAVFWSFWAAAGQVSAAIGTTAAVIVALGSSKREQKRALQARKLQHDTLRPKLALEVRDSNGTLTTQVTNCGWHPAVAVDLSTTSPDGTLCDLKVVNGVGPWSLAAGESRQVLWSYNAIEPSRSAEVRVTCTGLLGAVHTVLFPVSLTAGDRPQVGPAVETTIYPES